MHSHEAKNLAHLRNFEEEEMVLQTVNLMLQLVMGARKLLYVSSSILSL